MQLSNGMTDFDGVQVNGRLIIKFQHLVGVGDVFTACGVANRYQHSVMRGSRTRSTSQKARHGLVQTEMDGRKGAANELLDRLTSLEAELSPQLAPSRAPAPKDTTPPSPRASGLGSKLGAACGSPNGEQLVPTPPSARPPSSQSPNVGRVLRAREGGVTPRERRP